MNKPEDYLLGATSAITRDYERRVTEAIEEAMILVFQKTNVILTEIG